MARTGVEENKQANAEDAAQKNKAFQTAQTGVKQFNQNIDTLDRGGQVAANQYLNPTYLANVNRLQAGALNSNNNAAKFQLESLNRRTGGLNTGATSGAVRDMALQKMRLGDTLSSQRSAADWQNNIGYQLQMAQAPLQSAQAETPYYGGAVSGQNSALGNLTQFGIAQYGPYMAAIQAAGGAASAGLMPGGAITKAAGCWIAEALYGENDARTHLLRSWLNNEFKQRWYGRAVMAVYLRFGERIAVHVRRSPALRGVLKPWFEMALRQAVKERPHSNLVRQWEVA